MECPTKNDLLLYLVNEFQAPQEKNALRAHLDACRNCYEQALVLQQALNDIQQENGRECEIVMDNLSDYLDGKITTAAGVVLKSHLKECAICQNLERRLATEISYENVMALGYPVPASLAQKIEAILAANQGDSPLADLVESLAGKVDALVDRIVLALTPSAAPAFLGNHPAGTAQIQTTCTRDLKIDVGAAGRPAKIFSEDDVELDRQISDQNGLVIFKDFVPATYKLSVEGFDIKDVRLWP
ncbi:MAG: zf-HC2 domain-containing protein [candidate division KSB1 bacterium]|nr:zf-HC2 domain-containing protein [candidate division KSB1 bacterium]MDZ7369370.1 zf-HC2 domain-containing protein [candidate division KSB1 bacterium]MDZ7403205.1 zf-HC2 domain-containing protein [candidate division KSB1 bacterium]